MTRESNIIYENRSAFVLRQGDSFGVFRVGLTHSTGDSDYPRTVAGLSLAIARALWIETRRLGLPMLPTAGTLRLAESLFTDRKL